MKIVIERLYKKESYTIGKLYVNDKYFCDTLEDKDRGLRSDMSLEEIKAMKVYAQTAIPTGTYGVGRHWWTKHKMVVPVLVDVPGFNGILIHSGSTAKDTAGCILVGKNTQVGCLSDSRLTAIALSKLIFRELEKGEEVTCEIR